MKRLGILFILLAAVAAGNCQNAMDTISPCSRAANYYYGSLWADNFSQNCQGNCDIRGSVWEMTMFHQTIALRRCITATPLQIKGIAAPVFIDTLEGNYADTNREPEFFHLYAKTDTGITLLRSVRWDTATPHRVMQFFGLQPYGFLYPNAQANSDPYGDRIANYNVYEAYFDKDITISDTFYVGGTTNNNYCLTPGAYNYAHPGTRYLRWKYTYDLYDNSCGNAIPDPTSTDLIMYTGPESQIQETEFHSNALLWKGFGCIFPILVIPEDTVINHDTCFGTTGLRVLDISGRNVSLTWNDDGTASQWELSIVKGDTATATPDNGNINSYSSNFVQLHYLDSAWYTVYVRTVCDADKNLKSEWSEPVHFVIPKPDTTTTGFEPSLAEIYTILSPNPAKDAVNIFSSFTIKSITVISADGRTLAVKECDSNSVTMDIKGMPAGTLFVQIRTAGGTVTKKLLVSR